MARTVALLDNWIAARQAARFVWGESDCAMFVADWTAALTGRDPAAAYRGRYDSEATARRTGGEGAALARRFDRAFRAAGFPRARRPVPGDVGLVRPAGAKNVPTLGAIHAGDDEWLALTDGGMASVFRPQVVVAWAVAPRPGVAHG